VLVALQKEALVLLEGLILLCRGPVYLSPIHSVGDCVCIFENNSTAAIAYLDEMLEAGDGGTVEAAGGCPGEVVLQLSRVLLALDQIRIFLKSTSGPEKDLP
jgi:hypothetical protein